jgi:hypothetical protein
MAREAENRKAQPLGLGQEIVQTDAVVYPTFVTLSA